MRVLFRILFVTSFAACALSAHAAEPLARGVAPRLTPLAQITLPAWAFGSESRAQISGDRLLIPLGAGGVAIYDIADPSAPQQLALLDTATLGGQGGAIAELPGDRLFVSLPVEQKIAVFDLSAATPQRLGEFDAITYVTDLAVTDVGLVAYNQSNTEVTAGIDVYGVASAIPAATGAFRFPLTDPGFFATRSGTVYAGRTPASLGDPARVYTVDMSDPRNPQLRHEWLSPLLGNIQAIDVDGAHAYFAAYWGGLWVVDIAEDATMSLAGSFDWSEDPQRYAIDVASVAPFVLLLHGSPAVASRGLSTLRPRGDGSYAVLDTIAATGYPLGLARQGSLVVLEELVDVDGDGFADSKALRLFDTGGLDAIYANGFD